MKYKNIFFKICIICISFLLMLCVGFTGAALWYEKEIIDGVVRYVSERQGLVLKKESIALDIISGFPFCRISAEGVHVRKAGSAEAAGFDITAEHLYISINLMKFLMDREVEINRVGFVGGEARIITARRQSRQPLPYMNIHRIDILQCRVTIDKNTADIQDMEVGLLQDGEKMQIAAKGTFALLAGDIAALHPIMREEATVSLHINIDGNRTELGKSEVALGGIRCLLAGTFAQKEISLQAECKDANLERVAHFFLPETSKIQNVSGRAAIALSISGTQGAGGRLRGEGTAVISGTEASIAGHRIAIHDASVHFNASDLRNAQAYVCNVSNARIRLLQMEAQGDAKIEGFLSPRIALLANVEGSLQGLTDIIEKGEAHGQIEADIQGSEFDIKNIKGELEVSNATVVLQGRRYELDGAAQFTSNDLNIQRLQINCIWGDGTFAGSVRNYPALRQGNKNGAISVDGTLSADHITADSLLQLAGGGGDFPEVKVRLNIDANTVQMRGISCTDNHLSLHLDGASATVEEWTSRVFGGTLHADIRTSTHAGRIRSKASFSNINIENAPWFDKYYKQGSLRGLASGGINLSAPYGGTGFAPAELECEIDLTIENGRLVKFAPLQALSEVVRKDALADVKFLTLHNKINISGGAIHIPQMEVRSTALNSYIEGAHWFNGDYDYNITLFAVELLRGKAQRLDNPIREGKSRVFVHAFRRNGKSDMDFSTEIGRNIKEVLRKEQQSFSDAKDGKSTAQPSLQIEHEMLPSDIQSSSAAEKKTAKEEPKKEPQPVSIHWDDE